MLLNAYNCYDGGEGDFLPAISSPWPRTPKMTKNTSDGKPATLANNANNGRRKVSSDRNKARGKQKQQPKPANRETSAAMPASQAGASSESVARMANADTGRGNVGSSKRRRDGNAKGMPPTKPTA